MVTRTSTIWRPRGVCMLTLRPFCLSSGWNSKQILLWMHSASCSATTETYARDLVEMPSELSLPITSHFGTLGTATNIRFSEIDTFTPFLEMQRQQANKIHRAKVMVLQVHGVWASQCERHVCTYANYFMWTPCLLAVHTVDSTLCRPRL